MPAFATLGDRMKFYEENSPRNYLMPLLPAIVRLDGRSFHSFTAARCVKPFDAHLAGAMQKAMRELMLETSAVCGYWQSDEISLVLYTGDTKSLIYFDGRVDKINSVLAARCARTFNASYTGGDTSARKSEADFDCRCFNLPTSGEVYNYLLWREQDATRNSIQGAGQFYFSPTQMHKLNTKQVQEKLFQERQVNWNDYPTAFKRGMYACKVKRTGTVSEAERLLLPPKHRALTDPNFVYERSVIELTCLPPIARIANPYDVIFEGADPTVITTEQESQ